MTTSTRPDQETSRFLEYLDLWRQSLRPFSLTNEVSDPAAAAVFSTDMVVGFCVSGNLYSPRIGALIEPVVGLLQRAYAHGIRDFVLLQDTHQEDAPEFEAFPPHCVRGADESQAVREIRDLPFYDQFITVEKNSLDPASNTTFGAVARRQSPAPNSHHPRGLHGLVRLPARHAPANASQRPGYRGLPRDRACKCRGHLRPAGCEGTGDWRVRAPRRFLPGRRPLPPGAQRR